MRARTGSYDSVSEYFTANNTTSLTLRSLAEERDEPVTVTYDMSVANGKTIVNTKVQYNYLGGTTRPAHRQAAELHQGRRFADAGKRGCRNPDL